MLRYTPKIIAGLMTGLLLGCDATHDDSMSGDETSRESLASYDASAAKVATNVADHHRRMMAATGVDSMTPLEDDYQARMRTVMAELGVARDTLGHCAMGMGLVDDEGRAHDMDQMNAAAARFGTELERHGTMMARAADFDAARAEEARHDEALGAILEAMRAHRTEMGDAMMADGMGMCGMMNGRASP